MAASGLLELQRAFDEWQIVLDIGMSAANRSGDITGQASVTHQLGKLHADRQMPTEALQHFQRSLDLFASIGHRHGEGVATSYIAMAQRFLGRTDEALTSYTRALDLLTDSGDVGGQAHVLRGLGQIHLSHGDLTTAADHFDRTLELSRSRGPFRRIEAQTRFWLGTLRLKQGRLDDAHALFTTVFEDCRRLGDVTGIGQALRGLSQITSHATNLKPPGPPCYRRSA